VTQGFLIDSGRKLYKISQCFASKHCMLELIPIGLRADIGVVHSPVCPACCAVKFTLNIVDVTFFQINY